MQRSTKIILVYAELRRLLADEMTAGAIAALAARLVGAIDDPAVIDRCGTADPRLPGRTSLDDAFADGGWALLEAQRGSGLLGDNDDDDYPWTTRRHVAAMMENWA